MKRILSKLLACCFLITLITTAANAQEVNYYLDAENGLDTNDGSSASPFKTLTKGIALVADAANTGKTVILNAKGTFGDKSIVLDGGAETEFVYKVTIQKWDAPAIFDGALTDGRDRLFSSLNSTELTLKEITVKNYEATGEAGAGNGGAFSFTWHSHLIVESCNFISNKANNAGGAIQSGGFLTVKNSYFGENYAKLKGAAIQQQNKAIIIENTTIYKNYTTEGGEGDDPEVYVTNQGGALLLLSHKKVSTEITAINNTIVGNYCEEQAGVGVTFFKNGSHVNLNILAFKNNLIYNHVEGQSHAGENYDLMVNNAAVLNSANVANNIMELSHANAVFAENTNNQVIAEKDGVAPIDQFLLSSTLEMNDKGVYYLKLNEGSVAIDAGTTGTTTDITGNAVVGSTRDVGAYEFTTSVAKKAATITMKSEEILDFTGSDITPEFEVKDAQGVVIGLDVAPLNITYNNGSALPNAIDVYNVKVTIDPSSDYEGSFEGIIRVVDPNAIIKELATVTLSDLEVGYDGTEKMPTVTTDVEGLTVEITYDGALDKPVEIGSYAVIATIVDENYEGKAEGTLVITKGTVEVSISSLEHLYDGTPKSATVSVGNDDFEIFVTYNGVNSAPIKPGSYVVIAAIVDEKYSGIAMDTLVISERGGLADPLAIDNSILEVNVFPNPSIGQFTVELGNNEKANLSVYTLTGKEVLKTEVRNKKIITLPTELSGVLVVKLISDEKSKIVKIYVK
ncbi:MBG domain-containing protein [Flammeovirga kamogawensis]|uniref:T9SS type A sorting domain-containing protein n=1 Tax=Flammeovirga kamogawensis TaxID=373891 RepID=A0ABX8H2T7_9BACT|nr:MBG domain-containing protein [Flammeovirga kamogawensis]MBB6460423.1 hypothetical protein [Flammeovirga kamogawensis]QWG10228.1 T9SS type A sorting domain-containing protein [Flammeovirga kamogawensis]TRX64679.1 T9SS type A sorting domain-containing protein [Flammeovirga kamogawensis]